MADPAMSSGGEHVGSRRSLSRYALLLFVFAEPLDGWVISNLGTVGVVAGVVFAAAAVAAIFARGTLKRLPASHRALLGFVIWCAISLLWSKNGDDTVRRCLTLAQLFAAIWLWWQVSRRDEETGGQLLLAYVLGGYVLAGSTIWQAIRGESLFETETRFGAEGFDPNELGLMLALGIPMAWFALTQGQWARTARIILWAYLPVAFTGVLLTGSRGSLITVVVGSAIVPLLARGSRFRYGVVLSLLTVVAAVGGGLFVPETSLERFRNVQQEVATGTMGGRGAIWRGGLALLQDYPVLGVGAGAFPAMVEPLIGRRMVAHNTFLSVATETGIVGLAFFLAAFLGVVAAARRCDRMSRRFVLLLLMTWAVGSFALTSEHRKVTWIVFALAADFAWSRRGRLATGGRDEPEPA